MGGPAAGGQQGGAAPGGKGGQIPPELLAAQMAQQGQRGGAMPVQGKPVSHTQGLQANAQRQMLGGAGGMPSLASKAAAMRGAPGDKGARSAAMGNLPTGSLAAGAKGGAKRK